ncbi:hypothetical protein DES53_101780 [Roseimicrobium gellanilyticum]|uniref:Uncharacterized protein n=2 Tax=Roseimicrobium gellanilyticum TaxID=748857 RepID=A0A366HVR8_9BACT|nr:hypothetical protein DES53_101780 [Roseimicrobium gellanilyticum]
MKPSMSQPWVVLPLLHVVVSATIVLPALNVRGEQPAIDPLFPLLPSAVMKRAFPTTATTTSENSTAASRSEALRLTLRTMTLPASFAVRKDHGIHQLHKMIEDRPHMGQFLTYPSRRLDIVTVDDSIASWVIERFEGKHAGQPIFWKPTSHAADNLDAAQRYPSYWDGGCNGEPLSITIRDVSDPNLPTATHFEHAWSCLFFELLNAENLPNVNDLQMQIFSRSSIAREDYIKECARLEWSVFQKLEKVRKEVWIPWCKSHEFPHDPKVWRMRHADDFEAWYAAYTDPDGYPFSVYGPHYDAMRRWEGQINEWLKFKSGAQEEKAVPLLQLRPFAPDPMKGL